MNQLGAVSLSAKFKLFRLLFLIILFPLVRKIRGKENLPKDKAFIVASNHASIIDGLLLNTYLTRPLKRYIHFLTTIRHYDNPLNRFLMGTAKSIKIRAREVGKASSLALEYLKRGEILGVFPEGTRSPDGKIRKGMNGVATLALSARVPVVPVGLINTHKILPKGKFFLRYARCEINIGKALEFDQYYKDYDEAVKQNQRLKIVEIEQKVVRLIMQEIASLSNQKYPY